MELLDVMRTAGTCRYYKPDPVPDEVLKRVLDAARWAPQGGNRQPVRYVVVRDPQKKRQLRDWYYWTWQVYLGNARVGTGEGESAKIPQLLGDADDFAHRLHEVPVIVVVCAVMEDIYPTDLELDRDPVVYGASIYPSVQNLLLACRNEGLGATLTTLLCSDEPKVKKLLNIPDGVATAAHIAIGWPAKPFPKKLRRRPVGDYSYLDSYGESMFPDETSL